MSSLTKPELLQAFKVDLLKKVCPAESVIDYGGMWRVHGQYSILCRELGCNRVTMVDMYEAPEWQNESPLTDDIEFLKENFADPLFMATLRETYSLSIAFSIMLHQANLLDVLARILERTEETFCFCQPMIREMETSRGLVFLPEHPKEELSHQSLYNERVNFFQPGILHPSNWIWGMTPSFFHTALECNGFKVTYEEEFDDLSKRQWFWWGCIAKRQKLHPVFAVAKTRYSM